MNKVDARHFHGTMFCGMGGSCSGAQMAGLKASFAIDNNDMDQHGNERLPAIQTRKLNIGDDAGMIMSVKDFTPTRKHAARFVTASPPCKRFSTAAETREEDDVEQIDMDEDLMSLGFVAIEKALQVPYMEYYVMENVEPLLYDKNRKYLDGMVKMLEDKDFNVEWTVYNAHDFEICQVRHRLILIASKSGRKNLLPCAPVGVKKPKFADIMEDGRTTESRDRIKASRWSQSTYLTFLAKMMRGAGQMRIVIPDREQALEMGWLPEALSAFADIDVLPTIACNAGGGPTRKKWAILPFEGVDGLDLSGYRNATLLEGLRGQDFPDIWLPNLPVNSSQAWNMVGNAVPRRLMFYIMKHLQQLDDFHDRVGPMPASAMPHREARLNKMSKAKRQMEEEMAGMAGVFGKD